MFCANVKIFKFGTKNAFRNFEKALSYLKSMLSNFSNCKVKFETKNVSFEYFCAGILKKVLSNLKPTSSNLLNFKLLCKNKNS